MVGTFREAVEVLRRASGRCLDAPRPPKEEMLEAARFFIENSAWRRGARFLAYQDVAHAVYLAAKAMSLENRAGNNKRSAAEQVAKWLEAEVARVAQIDECRVVKPWQQGGPL